MAALLAWFASRGSQTAALQSSLNDALRLFMEESQRDRAQSTARVSELEHELEILHDQLGDARRDRLELSGEITNLRQAAESRLRLEEKTAHSPIPTKSVLRRPADDDEGGEDA